MFTDNPKVSVITPTYNHEKYISECIESVINQTFTNWEMIIIDDGSTDNTYNIANEFAVRDSRIRLFQQENLGIFKLAETYNKALHLAKGEYIAILEGDDYWVHQKLKLQVNKMQSDKDIVLGFGKADLKIGFQTNSFKQYPINTTKNLKFYDNYPLGTIFNVAFDDFLPPLTYIIKKEALLSIGGFIQENPFPSVDLSTVLALSKIGRFYFFNDVLGTWRTVPTQVTKTFSNEIFEGGNKIIVNHYYSLSEEIKKNLIFDEKYIFNQYKRRKIITYARSGRFKLIKHDFKEARKDYKTAILLYGFKEPLWKFRAVIGLIFSYFNTDIEWLAKTFGKGSLKID